MSLFPVGAIQQVTDLLGNETLSDAIGETLLTILAFFAVWVLGKTLGFRRSSNKAKKNSAKAIVVPAGQKSKSGPNGGKGDDNKAGARKGCAKETDLLAAAVRRGEGDKLPQLIDAASRRLSNDASVGDTADIKLMLATLRACAAKRAFGTALATFDKMPRERIGVGEGSLWSLLMWSAVEVEDYHRCEEFLTNLRSLGVLTNYDFVNIVRYFVEAKVNKADELATILAEFSEHNVEIDTLSRNRALSLCVSSHCFDLVSVVVDGTRGTPMDEAAYATLVKGYAAVGDSTTCLGIYQAMRSSGVRLLEATYGSLMTVLVERGKLEHVQEVFNDMKAAGTKLGSFHYTLFIKALITAGKPAEAMEMLVDMHQSNVSPDRTTYTTIIKEQANLGDVLDSMKVLDLMIEHGIKPDSAIFNSILTGCCARPMSAVLIQEVLEVLLIRGLKPSTMTLSILIKAFAKAQAWDAAIDMLEKAPARFQLNPEPRVYGQLGQACAQAGSGQHAIRAYITMLSACVARGIKVDINESNRLQRLCASCRQGARAGKIHQLVEQADGLLSAETFEALMREIGSQQTAE